MTNCSGLCSLGDHQISLLGTPSSKSSSSPEVFLLHHQHHPPLLSPPKEATLYCLSLRTLNVQLCHLSIVLGVHAPLCLPVCPNWSPPLSLYLIASTRHFGQRTSLLASSSDCPIVFLSQTSWFPHNSICTAICSKLPI